MSDNQRRTFCQILFLLLCVLPTSGIGYWICHPQTADGWERAIQAQLGITTKIDSVETPGPYVTILRGLEFTDPDGQPLFYTVETKIIYGSEFNKIVLPTKVSHLTNRGLAVLIENLNQNVVRKNATDKRWIVIFEKNATVEQVSGPEDLARAADGQFATFIKPLQLASSLTVAELRIDVGPGVPHADGTFAAARFKVAGPDGEAVSEDFVSCQISKTQQYGHVMELNTNEAPLPCWLLASAAVDLPAAIGSKATFNGALRFEPSAIISNIDIAGVFENVSLDAADTIVNDGQQASIQLNKCRFKNGELEDWDALLVRNDFPPRRIFQKDLFNYSRSLDVAQALFNTMHDSTPRSAELEVESNLR